MPRLFTALEIPETAATQLTLLQSGIPGVRWIAREDLHLTLRFIGDVERPMANDLAEALAVVKAEPFELQLEDLDVFGKSKPTSLHARVRHSDALNELQREHDRICQRVGMPPEGRKFIPHVTLARLRQAKLADVALYLSANGGFSSLPFKVSRFVLMSARDSVGGGPYVTEERYSLVERSSAHA